jgi:purine nucleoside permease
VSAQEAPSAPPRAVKVLIVSMFAPEAQPWIDKLGLTIEIPVPGLSADFPTAKCNADNVCLITTGMGKANAAASVSGILYSGKFDFTKSYFLIAGIAGIDPGQGTTGSAAWARYLVDYEIAWEIDAREKPASWTTGYLGINTKNPTQKPPLDYRSEVFKLSEALLQKALALSKNVVLEDSDVAKTYRARYAVGTPGAKPPSVIQCDTMAGDTWWHGNLLGQRASDWTKLMTDGQGTYCTTQQEDNASLEALRRGSSAGLLKLDRVAVLRTASNFDRPYPGQTAIDSLRHSDSGGFVPSTKNLYIAGGPLVRDIVANWSQWQNGVPAP